MALFTHFQHTNSVLSKPCGLPSLIVSVSGTMQATLVYVMKVSCQNLFFKQFRTVFSRELHGTQYIHCYIPPTVISTANNTYLSISCCFGAFSSSTCSFWHDASRLVDERDKHTVIWACMAVKWPVDLLGREYKLQGRDRVLETHTCYHATI